MMPLARRILIVDDDPDFLYLVRTVLRHVAAEVVGETSALGGLAAARKLRPDLIVCDVEMPRVDGLELRRKLLCEPSLAEVPFLFVSAHREAADHLKGLSLGAADYLAKPLDCEALTARVVHLLERARTPAKPVRAAPTAPALSGALPVVSVTDLLQLLEATRASGRLELDGPGWSGRLVVAQGVVVGAMANELEGEDAALQLLLLDEGTFRFVRGAVHGASGLSLRIGPLLMDAACIQDHLGKLGDSVPRGDDVIAIEDRAAALQLFPDSEAWQALVAARDRHTYRVAEIARRLGMGTLRTRAGLGRGVDSGWLLIV